MKYTNIINGKFVERPNRFLAIVDVGGEEVKCHVKNTGRCKELLIRGADVFLEPAKNPQRKTKYSLVAVKKGSRLINIDSQSPNKVVFEALEQGRVFDGITHIQPEYTYGKSRFDFYVEAEGEMWLVEVKGVTLECGGAVYFPDAPTERGLRHINELTAALAQGFSACVIFVIQMQDVEYFAPNHKTHPQFGEALKSAEMAGVRVLAYDCQVEGDSMIIGEPVPVRLDLETAEEDKYEI